MKRVNLAMTDEMYETIALVAELRGVSMSGLVVGMLEDFLAGWRREIKKLQPLREREQELEAEVATLRRRAARIGTRRKRSAK